MPTPKEFRNPSGEIVWRVQYRIDGKGTQSTFHNETAAKTFASVATKFGPEEAVRQLVRDTTNTRLVTFEEWTRRYLDIDTGLLTGVEPGTRAEYMRIAQRTLFPLLGDHPVDGIDKTTIGRWVAWAEQQPSHRRPNQPVSAKTVKNYHGVLSSILRAAVDHGLRTDNPAYRTRLSKGLADEAVFLSVDEYNKLYDAIAPRWRPLVAFLVGSQARWSEATALTWADINHDTVPPTVRISKAWKRRPGGTTVISVPKSPKARRTIALWPALVDELGAPGKAKDLVFANPDGTKIPQRTFAGAWDRAVKKANLSRNPRIHDLRHTGASWLIADGVPLPFIQQRLGHANITTTVGTYGHLLPDAHTRMADSLQGTMAKAIKHELEA